MQYVETYQTTLACIEFWIKPYCIQKRCSFSAHDVSCGVPFDAAKKFR